MHGIGSATTHRQATSTHVHLPTEANIAPRVDQRSTIATTGTTSTHTTVPGEGRRAAKNRTGRTGKPDAGEGGAAAAAGSRRRGRDQAVQCVRRLGQRRFLGVEQILHRPQQTERLLGQLLRVNFVAGNWQSLGSFR